jgi:uncharacterized protein
MATQANYHHGVRVVEINEGQRNIRIISTAVLGLICTASDADATAFPLNTPVLVTKVDAAIAKAGTLGTLSGALTAIRDQARPITVVVRVADGEGADAAAKLTDQNGKVIGTAVGSQYTGMQALLAAKAKLGVQPRILGAPGLDTQAVTTALVAVAQKLRAFVYAEGHGDDVSEVMDYRQNFDARELMLIWPRVKVATPGTGVVVDASPVAYAMGLRAKIDAEQGWHKTISNVPMNGVLGIDKDVFWDLQNPDTDAGLLNAAGITTLIRNQGFRFWGSRTCATDELFVFESATRTAQVLADTMAEGHFWAVDKPMHPSLVKDILEGINAKFRELKRLGYVLGASAWYDEEVNEAATLKNGKLTLDYDYTPVPPLEDLTFQQRITDRYYEDFTLRVGTGE